jgi:hypothetical protein
VTCQLLHIDGVIFVVVFSFVVFQGQGEQQLGQVLATIDQSACPSQGPWAHLHSNCVTLSSPRDSCPIHLAQMRAGI